MDTENKQWDMITDRMDDLCDKSEKEILIVAIDGKSGSGKTTLAARLQDRFGGNVFHMDDFFLRPEQRTKKRLEEVGGNVDYERFKEVLLRVRCGKCVHYQAFDCKQQELKEAVRMEPLRINIVEGAYSMHPYFEDIYDLRIGMDIDALSQKKRILQRNGEAMAERFEKEWIPKENAYLETFGIFEKCDLKINHQA